MIIMKFTFPLFASLIYLKANNAFTPRTHTTPRQNSLLFSSSNSSPSSQYQQLTDKYGVPIDTMKGVPAFPQQTPHSGCHYTDSHDEALKKEKLWGKLRRSNIPIIGRSQNKRRFMEGWYYRVTLPDTRESFAFIFSIEDPHSKKYSNPDENGISKSPYTLSCCQIMGPDDSYLIKSDKRDTIYWSWKNSQGLGCTFEYFDENHEPTTAMSPEKFRSDVKTGFQMLPFSLQGKIEGHDGIKGGLFNDDNALETEYCSWDLNITPQCGWGGDSNSLKQYSTAGWLASYPVFEPHWQITMALARASGTITWKGKTYNFKDMPFYAEKNWGGAFPIKWYWVQCNSFIDQPNLAVTAGGGTRKLPFLGTTEDLGMVGVHYEGVFYEAVPWTGTMSWKCAEWGEWILTGRCTEGPRKFEVELSTKCSAPGVKLRAPVQNGMQFMCRDSFYGECTLSLYELVYDSQTKEYTRGKLIVDKARSDTAAVEIGGGPWWDTWEGKSKMKNPARGLVKLPYVFQNAKRKITNVFTN